MAHGSRRNLAQMICIAVCLCMRELQSSTGGSLTETAITYSIFGKGTWNRTDYISRFQSLLKNNADNHPKANSEIK